MGKFSHIKAKIASVQWAITPEAFNGILAALDGELSEEDYHVFHGATADEHQALDSVLGNPAAETRHTRIAGSVGSISINGPIVPYADAFTDVSGLVSIDRLVSEFNALEQNPDINTIMLVFDSPGGAVTGISEFASLISASSKETIAYVYGHAASAAYWLASSAGSIVSADTGLVGSIGTIVTVDTEQKDKSVILRNSQSPRKALDPTTETGQEDMVAVLDQLADVFINDVAAGRGVDRKRVLESFGQGAVFGAAKAKKVGMIDQVLPLRNLALRLQASATFGDHVQAEHSTVGIMSATPLKQSDWIAVDKIDHANHACETNPHEENNMTFEELSRDYAEEIKAITDAARAEGMQAESDRFGGILSAVRPVLSSDNYPESIRAMAFKVLAGEENADVLRGAVAAIDAINAEKEANAAIADSDDIDDTPAVSSETPQLSEDGVLRNSLDADADIAKLKEFM